VAVLVALLVAAGVAAGPSSRASGSIPVWIRLIATPKTPEEPQGGHSKETWEKKKDEIWAQMRLNAQKGLTAAGSRAVPELLGLIKQTKDSSVKIVALTALSTMRDPADLREAGPAMVSLLPDENPGIRYLAIKTLGVMRFPAAAPHLHKLAKDEQAVVRLRVADALGGIGDFSSADTLLDLLADKEKSVRLHAMDALGVLGAALKVVPRLAARLESEDINERDSAAEAIKELLGYDIAADGRWLIARKAEQRAPIIKAFNDWWNETVKKIDIVIKDEPELSFRLSTALDKKQMMPVRLRSLQIIKKVNKKKAARHLIELMYERNDKIRQAVAETATALTGIRIRYRPNLTEPEWITLVDIFRRRLKGI